MRELTSAELSVVVGGYIPVSNTPYFEDEFMQSFYDTGFAEMSYSQDVGLIDRILDKIFPSRSTDKRDTDKQFIAACLVLGKSPKFEDNSDGGSFEVDPKSKKMKISIGGGSSTRSCQ